MNEKLSWDASLVKKYSSSNHFKLLNQLRNEIKKYPINRKNKSQPIIKSDNQFSNKSKSNISNSNDFSVGNDLNINNETYANKSTVSFNNSKNFSIYKNLSNDIKNQQKDNIALDETKSVEGTSTPSLNFKDRLNQVDMK